MTDHRDDPDLQLPIKLEPCSNGEFLPLPISDVASETIRRTHQEVDDHARRLGLSRRTFLRSVAGAALMLTVLDRTAREAGAAGGGRYRLPADAACNPDVARSFIGGEEFVFDVQVHYLNFDLAQPGGLGLGSLFPQRNCGETDPRPASRSTTCSRRCCSRATPTCSSCRPFPSPATATPCRSTTWRRSNAWSPSCAGAAVSSSRARPSRASAPPRNSGPRWSSCAKTTRSPRGRSIRTRAARRGGSTTTKPASRSRGPRSSRTSARWARTSSRSTRASVSSAATTSSTPTRSTSAPLPRPTPTSTSSSTTPGSSPGPPKARTRPKPRPPA